MTTNELVRHAPTMAMGSLEDPAELGRVLAASGYFQDVREAAQAVVKVLAGAELGFGPIASMTGVYIVKGRVTLSANLMAAAIKRHPRYDYRIAVHTNDRAEVKFFEGGKESGTSEFTMDDAKRAGLASGENWRKYPGNMLLWRAMSNGAKFFCPDAFAGAPVYTPDELGADVDPETGDVVELHVPGSAPTTPSPEPPSRAPSTDDAGTADRPDDAPENAAPSAPAAAPERVESADTQEGDPRNDLAALLEQVGAPGTFLRMAMIGYGAESPEDLTDVQAREIMGRAVSRFGGGKG